MKVRLVYFDGCPNWREAEQVVRAALRDVGLPEQSVDLQRVESPEDAERMSFQGSPTVMIDGEDPFADPFAPVGLMCRLYRTEDGLAGVPSREQLVEALTIRLWALNSAQVSGK